MKSEREQFYHGIGVSPGIAIGPAYVLESGSMQVPDTTIAAAHVADEITRFHNAVEHARKQLRKLKVKAAHLPEGALQEVGLLLDAHLSMLNGSRLVRGVENLIRQERLNAAAAVQRQINDLSASFAAMNDSYLASRMTDVREVGDRLIRNLLQQKYNPFRDAPLGAILIAEDFTPADTALMDPKRICGFAAVLGGAEGHAAIMARALGLPAVLGVAGLLRGLKTGDTVIIDGQAGTITVCPHAPTLRKARVAMARQDKAKARLKSLRRLPAVTHDGVGVNLYANLELPRELDGAVEAGAQGVGLLRTEFMFMNRADLPDEDEQAAHLCQIVDGLEGKICTIRTLDVGGEKLATSLRDSINASTNPALGLRAIRLGLKEPKLLETQLAAILRAAACGPVRILVPMISSAQQMQQVRVHLVNAARRLHRRGVKLPDRLPPLGAMIEIPAAALTADALALVSDFFAIGSNDLTQYTLAIDRGDDQVAELYNPLHPAVLRLIQFTAAAALRARIPVSLCGEMAGDPHLSPLLLGLGLRELSMAPQRLPEVKQRIRALTMGAAAALAEQIMAKSDEQEIAQLVLKLGRYSRVLP